MVLYNGSTPAVLDVKASQNQARDSSCGDHNDDDNVEHKVELADVQGGGGMM